MLAATKGLVLGDYFRVTDAHTTNGPCRRDRGSWCLSRRDSTRAAGRASCARDGAARSVCGGSVSGACCFFCGLRRRTPPLTRTARSNAAPSQHEHAFSWTLALPHASQEGFQRAVIRRRPDGHPTVAPAPPQVGVRLVLQRRQEHLAGACPSQLLDPFPNHLSGRGLHLKLRLKLRLNLRFAGPPLDARFLCGWNSYRPRLRKRPTFRNTPEGSSARSISTRVQATSSRIGTT